MTTRDRLENIRDFSIGAVGCIAVNFFLAFALQQLITGRGEGAMYLGFICVPIGFPVLNIAALWFLWSQGSRWMAGGVLSAFVVIIGLFLFLINN